VACEVEELAYDEPLAGRVRAILTTLPGHMCCGVVGNRLMVRVGPAAYEAALARPHVREMDFTGKPLMGFVYVEPPGFASKRDLKDWIARGAEFVSSLPPKKPRRATRGGG
jgi:hypothetical protein